MSISSRNIPQRRVARGGKANSEAGRRKKIVRMSERRLSERRVARSESGEVLRQRFREGLRQAKDGRTIEIGDDKSEEPSRW